MTDEQPSKGQEPEERICSPLNIQSWADVVDNPPNRAPVLIGSEHSGVLRLGHLMELTGASKAGKSIFALMLACSIATGSPCVGIPCKKGRVLYLNFEIDGPSLYGRIDTIWNRLKRQGVDVSSADNLHVLNMRANPLLEAGLGRLNEALAEAIGAKAAQEGADEVRGFYSCIVFDPFYMAFNGDENSASDVKEAVRQFLATAEATGASVIYIHHHSKGASGGKDSIDRGAGSGVHGRAPDAIVDITDLPTNEATTDQIHARYSPTAKALRMRFDVREFGPKKPIELIYDYPTYEVAPDDLGLKLCADKGKNAGAERKQEETDKKWKQLNEAITKRLGELDGEGYIERAQLYRDLDGIIPECTQETFNKYLKDNRCDYEIRKERIDGKVCWPVRLRESSL